MSLHNSKYQKTPVNELSLIDMAPELYSGVDEFDDVYEKLLSAVKHSVDAIIYVLYEADQLGIHSLEAMLPDDELESIVHEEWSRAIEVEYPDNVGVETGSQEEVHDLGIKINVGKKKDEEVRLTEGSDS